MTAELSVSLVGLEGAGPWSAGPRAAIEWASAAGFRAVVLDATAPGMRPRELDRSARRDLAALLRRLELTCTGLDLWIPEQHFQDQSTCDRAISAVAQALEMAAEVAGSLVSCALPNDVGGDVVGALSLAGDRVGATLADHAWPSVDRSQIPGLAFGLDPARVMLAGDDPVNAVFTTPPIAARLSDMAAEGRVAPGGGGLDLRAYAAALVTSAASAPVVLDLRSIRDPQTVASETRERWGGASLKPGA